MKKLLLLFSLLCIGFFAMAQQPILDSSLDKMFRLGADCSIRGQQDSAIAIFKNFMQILEGQNKTAHEKYSYALNNIGTCYKEKGMPKEAHAYMYRSLLHARQMKHIVVENVALLSLNNLHWTITKNNWLFDYPQAGLTYGSYVFFPVEKTLPYSKDSIIVVVYGGRNDGITDSSYTCRIYKTYDSSLKKHPDVANGNSIARGTIQKIEANRTYLIVKRSSDLPVQENDQANIYCQTPTVLKKSYFIDFFRYGINLSDYLKTDRLINRRFLYYYNDDKVNFGFIKILKQEMLEVQKYYADDTLKTNSLLAQKASSGIFKGMNVIRAMDSSGTRHIVRFLNFVSTYPAKYFGNTFSFAEVYATWLLNNTPLKPDDILDYLFTVDGERRVELTKALLDQIQDNNLTEHWVSDGLQYFEKDDMLHIKAIMLALGNVYRAGNDPSIAGWAKFFTGVYEYRTGDIAAAETTIKKADGFFTAASNKEGMALCKQAINKIHSNNQVQLQVQAGHASSYKVAMNPNGKYYATCGSDKTIRIWNIELGKQVQQINGHTDEVTNIAYSPNGRLFASCSRDRTIKLWSTFDYSLVGTIQTNAIDFCLAFSPNSKQLASGGDDSLIKMWDVAETKLLYTLKKHQGAVKQLCFVQKNENTLYSSGLDSMVYEWDLEQRKDVHWYRKKARLLNMKVSNDGNYLFYTANDTTVSVWNLINSKFYFSQKISFYKLGNSNNFGEPDFSPDGSMLIFPNSRNRLSIVDLASGQMNAITEGLPQYWYLNTMNFTPDGKKILLTYPYSSNSKLLDFKEFKTVDDIAKTNFSIKSFTNYANPPLVVQFSRNGNELYVVNEMLSKFNLTNGTTEHLFYSPQTVYNETVMLNDSLALQTKGESTVVVYNQITRDYVSECSLPNNIQLASFKPYQKKHSFFIAGKNGLVEKHPFLNNTIDNTKLFSIQLPLQKDETITFIKVDSFRNNIIVSTSENKLHIIDAGTGKTKATHLLKPFGDIAILPASIYINSHDGTIIQKDAATFKTLTTIKVEQQQNMASFIIPSSNYKYLAAYINETDFVVIDAVTNKIRYKQKAEDNYAFGLAISPDSKYLASSGLDNKVSLYDMATGKKMLNIFTPLNLDFVVADSAGNYLANKKSLEGLSFKYNDKLYSFDQFDIKFNRPDIVLQKTGKGDTALIEAYKKAVQKRIKKAGYTSEKDLQTTQLPFIVLTDQLNVELFTNLGQTEVTIECFDAKYPIKSLHVLVNNTPVYGVAGMPLGSNSKDTIVSVKIPLAYGMNNIKLFCTNSEGQNSLQQSLEIKSSYARNKNRKTWFVGIGVSDYKDSTMNLRYAAKDIRDLVGTFTKGKDSSLIHVDTLLNGRATVANILALKEKLMQADVNDKIIVAVTGHGLLNKDLDFYYATYDVDFNNPEKNGLKYEQLEALLDGVPAQQKLLLIDACHSGALDKEALLADKQKVFDRKTEQDTGKVTASSRSTIKVKRSKVSLNNSFELMQNMFADFSSSNGVVVISAAGGMEYAFESPQWNNGVFTYCVRKAVEENLASDGDGSISVQQLMQYVGKKVAELTNGRQRPTSRRENLEFDWNIK